MAESTALAPVEQVQPLTLFGTSDPVDVLHRAARVATALAQVLNEQKLYQLFKRTDKRTGEVRQSKYVTVEGWTLLGSMLGVFAQVEWTRRLRGVDSSDFSGDGWEARAVAIVAASGTVIGAGEAMCIRAEANWKDRDDYALRGMAQTRAISRALRGPLDFVVKLAGFASTPAEEIANGGE